MIANHPCVPNACIKYLFTGRAPVAVGGQALLPDLMAFETMLASFPLHSVRSLLLSDLARVVGLLFCRDLFCEPPHQAF